MLVIFPHNLLAVRAEDMLRTSKGTKIKADSITHPRRLPIQEDRMRELKDGGARQQRNERTRGISPQPLLHLAGDLSARERPDFLSRMVLRGRRSSRRSGPELWFFGKNHIHLGAGSGHFDAANFFKKFFREIARIDQTQKRAFRIGIGKHDARLDFRAVVEDHSFGAAVSSVNACNTCRRPNFSAAPPASAGKRVGNRAHSADNVAVETLQLLFASAQKMKQQAQRGSRLVRATVFSINVV